MVISTHTLTWSVTRVWTLRKVLHLFQLTRSRGAWHAKREQFRIIIDISTHTLTWSVTVVVCQREITIHISTHTLTWSVTIYIYQLLHPFKFQLTRSRGAWHLLFPLPVIADRFQLTRSRGAWLVTISSALKNGNFNSHAHVERDVGTAGATATDNIFQLTRSRGAWQGIWTGIQRCKEFQLTRSRGAWLCVQVALICMIYFNSHAHVERDLFSYSACRP